MHPEIRNSIFTVLDEPYCVWAWDLAERNASFVQGIDADYFDYIARNHIEHLEGENAQKAAIALRTNYHLCLEALFSLVGALIQAPDCVAGWVLKASTWQVREAARLLCEDRFEHQIKWKLPTTRIGFNEAARIVFQYSPWAATETDETVKNFGKLWYRLAQDFLDPYSIKEYNSIKHGFRARAGGFWMRMGEETQLGTPAPPDKMKDLGGSKFGTSFYSVEAIAGAAPNSGDHHITLRHNGLNWFPDATVNRMLLAATSIKNIKSLLLTISGKASKEMQYFRPEDPHSFDEPWSTAPGVISMNMDLTVSEANIRRASKEDLLAVIRRVSDAE